MKKIFALLVVLMVLFAPVNALFAGQSDGGSLSLGLIFAFSFGLVMKVVSASVTAPGAVITAVTAYAPDDSLQMVNPPSGKLWLIKQWVLSRTGGVLRTRSPQFGNDVQGLRLRHEAATPIPITQKGWKAEVKANDTLTQELSASAVAGDIEIVGNLFIYEGYSGLRSISPDMAERFKKSDTTLEMTIATGALGGYSGSAALSTGIFNLKASTLYAIRGYKVSSAVAATIGLKGPDFGGYRIGVPGGIDAASIALQTNFFYDLSREYGLPLVPVISFENLAQTFMDAAQNEDGADPIVTLYLVELGSEARQYVKG
jgi:hypothetical protein